MLDFLLSFSWAFFISVFAIPSIINVAHFKKLLDEPNIRTVHISLTPRLGGLAIFAGFTSAVTIFADIDKHVQEILAGAIVLFFIGLKDDIISVSPFKKFFVQVLATGIVVFMGDFRITSFQGFMGIYELDMGVSYAFTFLFVIGITNAINLIDGIDGLAGTLLVIITLSYGIVFYYSRSPELSMYAQLSFCLAGAILGFLRYNIYRAIIFMGDTGSLVSGFIVSVLTVKFIESKPVADAPAFAMAVLIVPIVDTLRVFIIRILNGRSPFSPDRNHLHHRLKDMGLSSIWVVLVLSGINLAAIWAVYTVSYLTITELVAYIVLSAIALSVVLELSHKFLLKSKP